VPTPRISTAIAVGIQSSHSQWSAFLFKRLANNFLIVSIHSRVRVVNDTGDQNSHLLYPVVDWRAGGYSKPMGFALNHIISSQY